MNENIIYQEEIENIIDNCSCFSINTLQDDTVDVLETENIIDEFVPNFIEYLNSKFNINLEIEQY